ncbi:hypothetical protein A3860_36530 [Niastella vici]|uniref:BAAT/Acyl-CoA thioester hydrolase C-terminal domain-containing protein n=2 Tax=Niastella vici TaxID=1703345 RepID=A0A1V9FMU9_9BACT|nr:hypothetical protein A3860_36530 [Niastella vici]
MYAQTNIQPISKSLPTTQSNRWDINKYMWTYAHNNVSQNNKNLIDFKIIDSWQQMSPYLAVSNNGRYFAYGIECVAGSPMGQKKLDSLIIQATNGTKWRYAFVNWQPGFFAANNNQYIMQRKDSLCLLQLGTNKFKTIINVKSHIVTGQLNQWMAYQTAIDNMVVLVNLLTGKTRQFQDVKLYTFDKAKKWLVCETYDSSKQLIIYNLQTDREQRFLGVKSYFFSPGGDKLIINTGTELQYNNFTDQTSKNIYTFHDPSDVVSNLQFDLAEKQVIFIVNEISNGNMSKYIWHYKEGNSKASIKINQQKTSLIPGTTIVSASFSDNGLYLNLILQQQPLILQQPAPDAVNLEVWDHKDLQLQTAQENVLKQNKTVNAIIDIEDGQVKWQGSEGEQLSLLQGDYAIIKRNNLRNVGDRFWENSNGDNTGTTWLITLKDGKQVLLPVYFNFYWFSPDGNYLIYFDPKQEYNYFSYELSTGKTTNISAGIPAKLNGLLFRLLLTDKEDERPYGPAAWLENDKGLLVYDNRDIWQLDITGQKKAINLTNGYGLKNDIILRVFNSERNGNPVPVINRNKSLLLLAYHANNKTYGLYRTKTGSASEPKLQSMGAWFMNMNGFRQLSIPNNGQPPVKSLQGDIWIVQRQSITDAPNYYATKDFKIFKKLTNLQPHQGYRWISQELHTFPHLNGQTGHGILYKPSDFNPSKKYPVLIVFYGGFSNNMHLFPIPNYNVCAITPGTSPVWFINNDYLVFTPDMYTTPYKIGPEAYNVIEGAANYLKSLPYVDASGLGCASHSWSAKLGAYIFTHSKSFGAMAISEGFLYANIINVALSIGETGNSKLDEVENGFLFGNLWKNKEEWLEQTTVLNVNKASSPLLLFCNKKSSQEYQDQTQQLFTALWRLEKKVWWLKYDKGGHVLYDQDEQKDYTVRYTQFFDHYLKKAPAPRWMTQGIPATLKGIEARYELDPEGSCGNDCKICQQWNAQYKRNPAMFQLPISEWSLDNK